jgi:hypothetical protein
MSHLILTAALTAMAAAPPEDVFFRERVAPVLQARCVGCHGGTAPKGGLALTSADKLAAGGDTGTAIVPGKPTDSLLYASVSGPRPRMPKKGQPLSAEEQEAIKAWIRSGAKWPAGLTLERSEDDWWSLKDLDRPALPQVKRPGWVRTPVDAFILARLERAGLDPNPEADRRTLIRRLTFDLHGLPPSPEDVAAFVSDPSPDAYERLVDRLLASPRYGERWGRHWLDVVHYADTHGYDKDKRRDNAWPYRDYVIRSFNEDKPYGEFIREQLAGDVVRPGDPTARIATGFIAAGPWDFVGHVELREGTVEKEKTRVLDRDDMVSNALATFCSVTIHCARCHDHKFDPIAQKDYYRLQAVFAGVARGDRPLGDPQHLARREALHRRRQELTAKKEQLQKSVAELSSPELVRARVELEELRARLAARTPAAGPPSATNGYHSAIEPGPNVTKWVQVDLGRAYPIDEVRLVPARPTDFPDTPGFGFPPRYSLLLSEDPSFREPAVAIEETARDVPNPGGEDVIVPLAGRKARYVRVVAHKLWKRTDDYVFALAELEVLSNGRNVARGAAVTALDSIEAGRWSTRHLVDGHDSRRQRPDLNDAGVRAALEEVRGIRERIRRAEGHVKELAAALVTAEVREELARVERDLAAVGAEEKALPPEPKVYAVVPVPPRPISVLHRGDVEQPRGRVTPGALACVRQLDPNFRLAADSPEGARRQALADWIADRRNPLTWRSIANRVWHYHFGKGLVDTPNDFGRNGSPPSHPELLDWLAAQFRDGGQSFRALHRVIVLSATYRQSSASRAEGARLDADNRLLWRMNRQRLDAECVRDAVLAVSGKLDLRMGGPGFELFRFKDDHSPVYDHAAAGVNDHPETWRRTVYRFTVRSVPNPFLDCLDCADPNVNTPVRNSTLTALQALALLNDPFMLRQAGFFAERLRARTADPAGQVRLAVELAFGRPPTADEAARLTDYAREHGLAALCRLLFNANEFVFID